MKTLGASFDESRLDKNLDNSLQPYPPSAPGDEDILPNIEGHEFEGILEIVEEIAEAARQRQEASSFQIPEPPQEPSTEAPIKTATAPIRETTSTPKEEPPAGEISQAEVLTVG